MSVQELKHLALKHWTKYLPNKVRELKASGQLNEALQGAASLAQDEIETLQKAGYREHEAREVALQRILLPEEKEDDEQSRELAEMERAYQENPPVQVAQGRPTDQISQPPISKSRTNSD